jgi:protein SPT2
MSERWQQLMAISASNTQKTNNEVEAALQQRRMREEQQKKERAEKEKKQLEADKQARLRHFENMQKEQERKAKEEELKKQKEAVLQRRIEEEKMALLHGPKKAKAKMAAANGGGGSGTDWPSSSSQDKTRAEVRRQRTTDEYDEPTGFDFLTREEKKKRKQAIELQKLMGGPKKSVSSNRYIKVGNKLRGGAVDMMTPDGGSATSGSGDKSKSVRQRLASMPNTLTKLNAVKRDTRTIDEIIQDRQRAKEGKTLDGDEAKEFDDWFTSKKDKSKKLAVTSAGPSGANTPSSRKWFSGILWLTL